MILRAKGSLLRLLVLLGGGLLGAALAIPASAQGANQVARQGMPQDWSHRHLIYSNPDTPEEAALKGGLGQWVTNYSDPRFVLQLVRKMEFAEASQGVGKATGAHGIKPRPTVYRDWSNVMGGASGVGNAGTFPAKYNFDIAAAPSCANDFVVFTTSSSGATSAGTAASRTGTVSGNMTDGNTVTITNGTRTLILTASATQNLGLFFQNVTSNNVRAANLANAIARNGGTVGVTASAAANVVTVTALSAGAGGNSIALAENQANFAWAGANLTGGAGTAGQPTVIAFNSLYSSCGTTPTQAVPATFWSYSTGNAAFTETSPVISLDGSQVVFVQRTGTAASLVVLKWSSTVSVGTVGAPTSPTSVTPAAYRACTAPCMTVMAFSGGPNNTNSSPYYDYVADVLYVGADNGTLHKFTGIFNSTPAESGAPWPVSVSAGNILSPPVYDPGTALVFVGSARETSGAVGGRVHSVNASGTVVSSGLLAGSPVGSGSTGVSDSPIVDSTAQRVYAFVASDTSTGCGGVECHAIYQFPTNASIAGLTTPRVQVGRGQIFDRVLYTGAFDSAYYASTPASPTGNLYVCGSLADGSQSRRPTLWKIPITANVMGIPVVGPALVGAVNTGECSPITDVMNGTNNYLFMSVPANGNDTGCAGACIYMYNLTGIAWGPAATASAGLPAAGGTGGIVIDNTSLTTGASEVYYSTLTSPGSAVQASQAGLN